MLTVSEIREVSATSARRSGLLGLQGAQCWQPARQVPSRCIKSVRSARGGTDLTTNQTATKEI